LSATIGWARHTLLFCGATKNKLRCYKHSCIL
jgi:hypothetical protein